MGLKERFLDKQKRTDQQIQCAFLSNTNKADIINDKWWGAYSAQQRLGKCWGLFRCWRMPMGRWRILTRAIECEGRNSDGSGQWGDGFRRKNATETSKTVIARGKM